MTDDPLAGTDRTVIMPMPGGRVATGRGATADEGDDPAAAIHTTGLNPLVAAANPLLDVVPPLRASAQHPDPAALRESLARGIRDFEARAKAAGAAPEKTVAARYALCTLIDETAASTPWGASGRWAQHGLLALFHGETEGGEKFFQLLARLLENPHGNLDLIELMYICLQLGLEGRYRVVEGGHRQLDMIRQRLVSVIRKERGEYERDLSAAASRAPAATQHRLGWLPLWVVGAVAALVLVGIYLAFALRVSRASDAIAAEIAALRVAANISVNVPARPPTPTARLAPFLAEEIRRQLVAVDDRADRSTVTILGDGLFKPGDAVVRTADQWLLLRIADALLKVPGQVDVIGHTDNVPIRTLRFPSNWELSRARAESVGKLLASLVPGDRIRVEGHGDTEPVVSNETPQGRARNRRVEIVLHVPPGSESRPPAAASAPGR
jgi:type VI secretion system protein ImpK